MRKVLILAIVAMMTTMGTKAQTGYEDTKHEVAVSYGWLSTHQGKVSRHQDYSD